MRERGRERVQWVGERKRWWRKGVGRMGTRKQWRGRGREREWWGKGVGCNRGRSEGRARTGRWRV